VKGRSLLTESDIASNVLFGISSERLGFNPVLIGAANGSSDVWEK
jgi:hypothetical protein